MWDALSKVVNVFFDNNYSKGSRVILFIVIVMIALLFNNLFGFTFYYELRQKTALVKEFENLKEQRPDNKVLIDFIDEAEQKVIERKNIINGFVELFSREDFKPDIGIQRPEFPPGKDITHKLLIDTVPREKIIDSIADSAISSVEPGYSYEFQLGVDWDSIWKNSPPGESIVNLQYSTNAAKRYRSRLWHTISSGALIVVLALFVFILMLFVPFYSKKENRLSVFIGILMVFPFLAMWLWLFQWLLGLIPVINNMPWINYLINIGVNILIVIALTLYFQRKEKKKEQEKQEA
ncbi:hypothetical protein OU798_04440 [Prolixibacteraceae bacterium Z1-6]|uniref:Uncharacterized protein n=1 Tax=Draconibacterium aestuarii TaxID=2998507 RepID=A0A9X3F304_9BACT|nr:hypothetical protein [Prolixibacteraceae bacterium Z1-6]